MFSLGVFSHTHVSLGSWESGLFEGKTVKVACSSQCPQGGESALSGGQAPPQQEALSPPHSTGHLRETDVAKGTAEHLEI